MAVSFSCHSCHLNVMLEIANYLHIYLLYLFTVITIVLLL